MGQAKHNPAAIAAKAGEIQPKEPRPSKRESERQMYRRLLSKMPHFDGMASYTVDKFMGR
jgi:hypothetical protein